MEISLKCQRCGSAILDADSICATCAMPTPASWRAELLLAGLVIGACVLYAITSFAAHGYWQQRQSLATGWGQRGRAAMAGGDNDGAAVAFRNAQHYARDNMQYRLDLAQALVAAGRVEEARSYLLDLRESEPASGTINLDLARLAAREHDVPTATRYYHNAIYGVWESDGPRRRLEARMELAQLLVTNGKGSQAEPELITLAADLPASDIRAHARIGELFLQTGNYSRALAEFREVLSQDRRDVAACVGAAKAAYDLRDDTAALRYLSRVEGELPPEGQALKERVTAVENADPFRHGLNSLERARRLLRAYAAAEDRLHACAKLLGVDLAAPDGRDELQAAVRGMAERKRFRRAADLSHDPDRWDGVAEQVFRVERMTARRCGEPQGLDAALLTLAQRHSER